METRTVYVPANAFGRNVLALIWSQVSCSMGAIRKLDQVLSVDITMPAHEINKVERILQKFDLA